MKNSHPIIKNSTIPTRTLEKLPEISSYAVENSFVPRSTNTISKEVSAINAGLKCASQVTMIAVNPRPPAVVVEVEVPAELLNPPIDVDEGEQDPERNEQGVPGDVEFPEEREGDAVHPEFLDPKAGKRYFGNARGCQ